MKKMYSVIENIGWSVTEIKTDNKKTGLELSKFSPAGEDYNFYIEFDGTKENLNEEINEYYENFDVDEHVEMWIEAKKNGVSGVPNSIRQLLEDAEAIEEMIEKLSYVVENEIK